MKYKQESNKGKFPIFTPKEKLVIMYFLENDNKETYPTKISKDLKEKISKPHTISICEKLLKNGIFKSKKIKPPRQKHKTDWYFLKDDFQSFKKIAYSFLISNNSNEHLDFIQTNFVQKTINENFIRTIFHNLGFCVTINFPYRNLPETEQKIIYFKLKEFFERNGDEYFLSFETVPTKKVKQMKKENPNLKIFIYSGYSLSIRFPLFHNDISEEDKRIIFEKFNKLHYEVDDIYNYSIVKDYYKQEPKEINEFIQKYLILLQISPNALKDMLYYYNYEELQKTQISKWTVLDKIGITAYNNIEKRILPQLVINTVFDLAKSDKLPQNSIVKKAIVIENPVTMELTEPLLKLMLEDGNEHSFPLGFVLDKKGVSTFNIEI